MTTPITLEQAEAALDRAKAEPMSDDTPIPLNELKLESEINLVTHHVRIGSKTTLEATHMLLDLARRYAASQRPVVPDGVEQQIEALRQNHDSANKTNAVLVKRLVSTMTELAKLRARCEAMHEAIEVYALPLIWALKCDGKLEDGTTAEKVLRSVATPPYVIPALPATEGGGG
jgi:hypothetical protein